MSSTDLWCYGATRLRSTSRHRGLPRRSHPPFLLRACCVLSGTASAYALRACYVMSRTDFAYVPGACYGMSGTDAAHGGTSARRKTRLAYGTPLLLPRVIMPHDDDADNDDKDDASHHGENDDGYMGD
eukprot:225033-Rhodomonas_salina.15